MADSLAFNVSVPAARLDALLALLATRVVDQALTDRASALRAGTMIDLTLHFPPDDALAAFADTHPELQSLDASVVFGYLTLSSIPRGSCLDLSFFSSSRAIAELLRYSQEVRSFFRGFAQFGDPPVVSVVDEWGNVASL